MSTEKSSFPLIDEVWNCLRRGRREPYAFDPDSLEKLKVSLARLFRSPVLKEVMLELVTIAYFLDTQQHSPAAAKALLDIASTSTQALTRLGDTLSAEPLPDYACVTGYTQPIKASAQNTAPPPGSVSGGRMAPYHLRAFQLPDMVGNSSPPAPD